MKEVFYGQLPKPLSDNELMDLLIRYNNGDYSVRDKIINHNIRLIINLVINKFNGTIYEQNELVSIGLTELIRCLDTYDINKNIKFSTFVYNCVKNRLLNYIRDNDKRNIDTYSYDNQISEDSTYEQFIPSEERIEEDYETKERNLIIRELLLKLNERDRNIMMLYYGFIDNKCYTYREIGDMYNVSGAYIGQIIKKNLKIIKESLELQYKIVRR